MLAEASMTIILCAGWRGRKKAPSSLMSGSASARHTKTRINDADGQQDELFDPQTPRVLANRFEQKPHGSPVRLADTCACSENG